MSSDKIDIIEIASNWPSLGQGNHSEVVRWHHSLKSVVDEIATLKQEIVDLKKVNEMQENELIQLNSSPSTATSTLVSFAAIIAGQYTESKQQQHQLINFIATENKDRQEREQDIIISGLSESPTSNDIDLVKQFFHEVNQSRLSPSSSRIQASTIKSVRRLKSSNLSSSNPSLVLVSFSNPSDRDNAIKACSRHRAADFANVMVREDRTPAQQAAFIKQEIRKLNDELETYKLLEQYRNVLHKSRNTVVCIDLAKSAAAKNYVIVQHKVIVENAKKELGL